MAPPKPPSSISWGGPLALSAILLIASVALYSDRIFPQRSNGAIANMMMLNDPIAAWAAIAKSKEAERSPPTAIVQAPRSASHRVLKVRGSWVAAHDYYTQWAAMDGPGYLSALRDIQKPPYSFTADTEGMKDYHAWVCYERRPDLGRRVAAGYRFVGPGPGPGGSGQQKHDVRQCVVNKMNRYVACLRNKTILFAGDSVIKQTYWSFLALLAGKTPARLIGMACHHKWRYSKDVARRKVDSCTLRYEKTYHWKLSRAYTSLMTDAERLEENPKGRAPTSIPKFAHPNCNDFLVLNPAHGIPTHDHVDAYSAAFLDAVTHAVHASCINQTHVVVFDRHVKGYSWGTTFRNGSCTTGATLLHDAHGLSSSETTRERAESLAQHLRHSRSPARITIVDMFDLDFPRVDAYPGLGVWKQGGRWSDCTHRCLPGVPDWWNAYVLANVMCPKEGCADERLMREA